ncbi:MAG: glutamine synthetase III [Spirochaetes bacterium]|nr:glutamine synthetase III [Spirochaetota bacterium]
MHDITELFGSNVFSEKLMKERLPKETYRSLKETIESGAPLKAATANVVANAMKDWAIEHGATHYTHWFQPLTNMTAEKHDAFISPTDDGGVIMEFSGKQLIQGEPDASSFPSGGLRATFEARGYTAWDCTSPAFLKNDGTGSVTLCIPTVFCSYHGEALDKKTPLLRSMRAVSTHALRVIKALGNTASRSVTSTVGPEQEYFLIDKSYYRERLDLIMCGRTLFGSPSPKGQELEDQYFGSIKDRVAAFMKELDIELWRMGVSAKTEHNEVAPGQFEIAPIFATTNIATDHNQLVMETLQKVALRHDFVCLLHEKPYAGINGSGKHNNWSLSTDDGINLLEPGQTPHENQQFLAFCAAVIQAVDTHADILRATTASSGNDHRLGANEAPPAIISIFLGEILTDVFTKISRGEKVIAGGNVFVAVGVDTLPPLPKDNSDRNRTSPFAFTGNKFEFRMVGSSASVAGPNVVLNTIVAESLDALAGRLEKAKDVGTEIAAYVKDVMAKHGRIIFNGNNYSEAWVSEATKRGLPNVRNAVDALKAFISPKSEALFEKYSILTKAELHSRYEIYTEQYAKHINIEAQTAVHMARRLYIPAAIGYVSILKASLDDLKTAAAGETLASLGISIDGAFAAVKKIEDAVKTAKQQSDTVAQASFFRDTMMPLLAELRLHVDALECIMPKDVWPVPYYSEMLFDL